MLLGDRARCRSAGRTSGRATPTRGIVSARARVPVALYVADARPASALAHARSSTCPSSCSLGALFTISGGIVLRGDLRATPRDQHGVPAGSARCCANLIGTTGASMLLIRPLLQTNCERKHVAHIPILFIFVVSNCGGLLTPLGDPPLFLGYLRGVPFFWTLRLVPEWLFVVAHACSVVYLVDGHAARVAQGAARRPPARRRRAAAAAASRAATTSSTCSGVLAVLVSPSLPDGAVQDGVAARRHARHDGALALRRTPSGASHGERLHLRPDHRGGGALRRASSLTMIPRARDPLNARGAELGVARALAVLLGDRGAVVVPRQRADLPHLRVAGAEPRARSDVAVHLAGGPVLGDAARRDLGRARVLHGRQQLHRQRSELHGEGDRRGAAASRCRASAATCSGRARS